MSQNFALLTLHYVWPKRTKASISRFDSSLLNNVSQFAAHVKEHTSGCSWCRRQGISSIENKLSTVCPVLHVEAMAYIARKL
jgi:hypothetical protein